MRFPPFKTSGRLCTPEPTHDPLTTVQGVATVYSCRTLAETDAHLADVGQRLTQTPDKFPRLKAQYQRDLDALLERRMFQMECLAVPAAGVND